MPSCDFIQDCLARDGPARMQADAELRDHVQGCNRCTEFLEALTRLDAASRQLPDHDAPDPLVIKTAQAIADAAKAGARQDGAYRQRRRWATGFATAAVVLAAVGLSRNVSQFIPSERVLAGKRAGAPMEWVDASREQAVARTSALDPSGPQEEKVMGEVAMEPQSVEMQPSLYEAAIPEVEQEAADRPERWNEKARYNRESRRPDGSAGTVLGKPMPRKKADRQGPKSYRPRSQTEKLDRYMPMDLEVPELAMEMEEPMQMERQEKAYGAAAPAPAAPATRAVGKGSAVSAGHEFDLAGGDRFEIRAGSYDGDESDLPLSSSPVAVASPEVVAGEGGWDDDADPGIGKRSRNGLHGAQSAQDKITGARALKSRIGKEKRKAAERRLEAKETLKNQVTDEAYFFYRDSNRQLNAKPGRRPLAKPGRERRPAPMLDKKTETSASLRPKSPVPAEEDRIAPGLKISGSLGDVALDQARLAARRFLAERANLKDLGFREATGYWVNTYVPGDPAMRLLETRLRAWDRRHLEAALQTTPRMERAARPNWQPFDAPRNSALALYLHADRRAIEGPSRVLLQVGLKGSLRQSGRRPAMNVGLVVDLRPGMEPGLSAEVRALITGLEQARQPGDRFSLTVAGRPGGLLVPPDQFRHGPLQVVMGRIFAGEEPPEGPALGLVQAVSQAMESVRKGDDPTATLGSSLVLLVSASPVTPHMPELERLAHGGAVRGISLSVVPLGMRRDLDDIGRLVAAGQGNRRILGVTAEATALIERELHAASGVVARAVRLRIRLAPGVRLVDVLGSRRLGEPQAQRVREAEQSIDRRMARNLGIRADRGEDEEGIQMVIPNFHAGDAHVVLLDVVAARPGPVADVSARYKDVVYLRNGTARTHLVLESGERPQGPLEHNVLKNLLAWRLAVTSRQAARHLAVGMQGEAVALLHALRTLLYGLRHEIPGWTADEEILNDERMLAEYTILLGSPAATDAGQRRRLAESLRYAGFRRLARVSGEHDKKAK